MKINSPSEFHNKAYQCEKCIPGKRIVNVTKEKGIFITCDNCDYELDTNEELNDIFKESLREYLTSEDN